MSTAELKFMTEREIIDDIMENFSAEDKSLLRQDIKGELIKYHHNWGRHIRNYYNMWKKENPYTVYDDPTHDDFPDQRSMQIIEGVWELIQIVK